MGKILTRIFHKLSLSSAKILCKKWDNDLYLISTAESQITLGLLLQFSAILALYFFCFYLDTLFKELYCNHCF